jgi:hypothetical protein
LPNSWKKVAKRVAKVSKSIALKSKTSSYF